MRHIRKTIGVAAAAAVCALTASTGTAQAQPDSLYAPSSLVLTHGWGEEAMTAVVDRAVTLNCAPAPSGSHPAAEGACSELRAVNAEFAALSDPDPGVFCTREYNPVVVTADGVWEGRRVSWSQTFGNPCEMRASLGDTAAFAF
ncbi:subtilase-type protease inhibitor [Streptomyces sp. HNM0663]|uniref:Probable subtilase-type protease inhibitor n=1 Tax=Streptomyces chengmaiensis TaxID=3040919 RepID=A0ABT6HUZ4_9ACTN|nr:subtilase-type protease inhibitor [Streptomyces chengmaiensis]MDH2392531.1 subtilase-type protease inhibitor [Streptomyces chengmaiensis]